MKQNIRQELDYFRVDYPEPHLERMRQIMAAHPEVKQLFGFRRSSAWYVLGIVVLQVLVTMAVSQSPWWMILLTAYTVGAVADHALWVLIHECTHNLIFKSQQANCWLQVFANIPIIFPSSMSFRIYHIQHHLHQGNMDKDADLTRPKEAKFIGKSFGMKSLWLLFFFISQLSHVQHMKGIPLFNRWVLANVVVQTAFLGTMYWFFGWGALIYLALGSIFAIGLHPLGARWIQEHYVVQPLQETYSYYGPLNTVAFNVGYHNEHHDFMRVPWMNLPKVRALAPEFYNSLYFHTSWSGLLWKFLTDREINLFSRVIRVAKAR